MRNKQSQRFHHCRQDSSVLIMNNQLTFKLHKNKNIFLNCKIDYDDPLAFDIYLIFKQTFLHISHNKLEILWQHFDVIFLVCNDN